MWTELLVRNVTNVSHNAVAPMCVSGEPNITYLSDCKTAFMKHVLPRLRRPVVFGRKD